MRGHHQHYARMTHPHPHRHVVPIAVLTTSRLVLLTATRPVTNGTLQHALKDKGVIDSGCSRHMIGNISYLSEYEEINGGYVAFGRNPKGGKITGKGKIMTGKLDFDDVYFVKELKFNLFSVSQMCDKKNIVLFTYTECIVLSSDFKLPDDNHVLLRVLTENNMYKVDLKNIVASGDLTYPETQMEEDLKIFLERENKRKSVCKISCNRIEIVSSTHLPLWEVGSKLLGLSPDTRDQLAYI
nr:ribonuclease H-like domain-containing protein [Tanacetum cinerariifolium]